MAISARRRLARVHEAQWRLPEAAEVEAGPGLIVCPAAVKRAAAAPSRTHPDRRSGGMHAPKISRAPFATISLASVGLGASGSSEAKANSQRPPQPPARRPQFTIASAPGEVRTPDGIPAWRHVLGNLAAGATAGCAVEAALYPIDTIKTRMQMAVGGEGVRALFKSGGGKALYAGVWGNLVGVAPSTAVFMAVYEPMKQAVTRRVPDDRAFLGPLVAGAASGLVASFIRVPTEVVKQRMQSGEFNGALNALKTITTKEGARGLYAGYGSFLLRDLPFDAIEVRNEWGVRMRNFVTYEQLRKVYKASLAGSREVNGAETALMGALAGAVTGVLTTPFDVLKTRLMTQGAGGRYKHVGDCAAKILREEGSAAFFAGWQPRVLWISIGGCVFFTALEQAKQFYAPKGVVVEKSH